MTAAQAIASVAESAACAFMVWAFFKYLKDTD